MTKTNEKKVTWSMLLATINPEWRATLKALDDGVAGEKERAEAWVTENVGPGGLRNLVDKLIGGFMDIRIARHGEPRNANERKQWEQVAAIEAVIRILERVEKDPAFCLGVVVRGSSKTLASCFATIHGAESAEATEETVKAEILMVVDNLLLLSARRAA